MTWNEGPLAGFDVESTGTDPETARIVTACVAVDRPGEEPEFLTWLADPGVEIPVGAAKVHGVTTEIAKAEGEPAEGVTGEIARSLAVVNSGLPLVIYNAPYDLTVLDREARRYGLEPVIAGWEPAVIDPLVLDKQLDCYRRGSRRLADVCAHYGVRLDNAHDATADTLAAIALARRLAAVYPVIADMTPEELHRFQVKAKAEQAASFQDYLRRKGSAEVIDPSWPMVRRAA